ncbi:carbohydrate esterase family 9 protein [Ilyonectria sp. MPI-CAGE-AT-0026]|nr:carbohydrate esterase family 9 protein [Ilyonectria sp. MPI-CAGE-AT-0026]
MAGWLQFSKPDTLPSYDDAVSAYRLGGPFMARIRRRLQQCSAFYVRFVLAFLIGGLCFASFHGYALRPRAHVLSDASTLHFLRRFHASTTQCDAISIFPERPAMPRRNNPRWSDKTGQKMTIVLRNATLFDGQKVLPYPMDVIFTKGLIVRITETSNKYNPPKDALEFNLGGRWTTPGLVDMHSHHLLMSWPGNDMTDDGNELNKETGAITAMGRVIDALKPYDLATSLICSGGVTSSLILPGSANLIGGEGVPVKNAVRSGESGEPTVEDMLLERGVPWESRRRYMKMAFGENPKVVWDHTRQGTAMLLRKHMQKAKELMDKQDDFCVAIKSSSTWSDHQKAQFIQENGVFPSQIELESTIGVLRGKILVQNHNYEPEDMETMLRISHEFGFRVGAFHHALEAWQVPELLLREGDNITIATFAEFSLYKQEAYFPSLFSSSILHQSHVPVAFKSDHSVGGVLNAKYLLSQAAVGHAFHLPEEAALQSVTSIPAKAIGLDYRIGYAQVGYDADIAIWDSHPLSTGATPLQVFIDGRPQLDQSQVTEATGTNISDMFWGNMPGKKPQVRFEPEEDQREDVCVKSIGADGFIINGIRKAFVDNYPELAAEVELVQEHEELRLVIDDGRIVCLGPPPKCDRWSNALKVRGNPVEISLRNGHLLPGLTAMTGGLGMREIDVIKTTGDGDAVGQSIDDPDSVVYAKYGVWLDGKTFARARLGGVTRAISPPIGDASGFVHGISVEILTSGKRTLFNGGIVQGEVALHVAIDDMTQDSEGTISNGIKRLRKMIETRTSRNETVYDRVASGILPLVVYSNNKYDLQQIILLKRDFPTVNLIILGGKEIHLVAKELVAAHIPVILSESRPAPETFRGKDALPGPPLSRSTASYLSEAGVHYALASLELPFTTSFRIHELGPEAGWVAKFAGLDDREAIRLVTSNLESILGLKPSKDLVIFEGNPLEFGATTVLIFEQDEDVGKLEVSTCFPREHQGRSK